MYMYEERDMEVQNPESENLQVEKVEEIRKMQMTWPTTEMH